MALALWPCRDRHCRGDCSSVLASRLSSGQPLPTFFFATLLVSVFLGLGPGLLATFLSVLSASYFFMEPLNGFKTHNLNDVIRLSTFVALGLSINVVAE